jgi:holo-[acyl-carrier protein] synthase
LSIFCGTDIIEINRIEKSFLSSGDAFRDRLFTKNEIEYCESKKAVKYKSYAARFAAKEAVSKAFGTGISEGISWTDIEIVNDSRGCPSVVLHGNAEKLFRSAGGTTLSISLSHCENYAVAYVVMETK